MTTTITRSFQAEESIEHVWLNISNPEKLVTCLPGASLTETIDDKNFKGEVKMKFGPLITDVTHSVFDEFTANFKAKLKGEDVDNSINAGKMMGTVVKSLFKKDSDAKSE